MRARPISRYVPRRPSRHAIKLGCQIVRERDFKLVSDELIELSERGALVVPKVPIITGDSLIVTFMAPFTRTFVDAEATVARIVHGRRIGDTGPLAGISIDGMDEACRALIKSQLTFLPVAAPRRRIPS
jgi:hypothetical protein